MKQNLPNVAVLGVLTAIVVGGLAVAAVTGFTVGQNQSVTSTRSHWSCDEAMLERLPTTLNITVGQMDNFRRIKDRAEPQLVAIRLDARQKKQAIMDATISEISGLLTPEQLKKLDDLQKAREEARRAKRKLRVALQPASPFDSD